MRLNRFRIFRNADGGDSGGEPPEIDELEIGDGADDGASDNDNDEPVVREIPTTKEELDALSPEERKSLEEHLLSKGDDVDDLDEDPDHDNEKSDDKKKDDPTPEGEQSEVFGLDPEALAQTPSVVIQKLDELKQTLAEIGDYIDPDVRGGIDILMKDEQIQNRLAVLKGEKKEVIDRDYDKVLSTDNLSRLGIDFDSDPERSTKTIRRIFGEIGKQIEDNVRLEYEEKARISESRRVVTDTLKGIQSLNKDFKSDLDFNDPKHPMREAILFFNDNRDKFNITGIGPQESYRMYLKSIGKLGDFEKQIEKNARQNMQSNLKKKAMEVKTLPKGRVANQATQTNSGVDKARFLKDENYRNEIHHKYIADPQMRAKFETWARGE